RPGHGDDEPEEDRVGNRDEVLLVERNERDEDRAGRPEDEPLPGLPRRQRRRELVAPDQPAGEERADVSRPHGEEHGERREPAVLGDIPQKEQVRKTEPDPRGAENRRSDR